MTSEVLDKNKCFAKNILSVITCMAINSQKKILFNETFSFSKVYSSVTSKGKNKKLKNQIKWASRETFNNFFFNEIVT